MKCPLCGRPTTKREGRDFCSRCGDVGKQEFDERESMRRAAQTQPYNRARLADRATRAGQAIAGESRKEADKWFALAAEIRGMGLPRLVQSTTSKSAVDGKYTELEGGTVAPVEREPTVGDFIAGEEPTVEEEPISEVLSPPTYAPTKRTRAERPGKGSKHDKNVKDILFDYRRMPVKDLERKWGITRNHFYPLKNRWARKGFTIPTAYSSRPAAPGAAGDRTGKVGRPRTGEHLRCPDCGKDLYIRRHRLDESPEAVHRCRSCAGKHSSLVAKRRAETPVPNGADSSGNMPKNPRDRLIWLEGYQQAIQDAVIAEEGTKEGGDK